MSLYRYYIISLMRQGNMQPPPRNETQRARTQGLSPRMRARAHYLYIMCYCVCVCVCV